MDEIRSYAGTGILRSAYREGRNGDMIGSGHSIDGLGARQGQS